MGQKARTMIPLLCAAFLFTALCPPARAEARAEKPGSPEAPEASPDKKNQKTKKKRKAKQVKAESEYKFIAADATPSYHFDKKGDPILKRGKYAKDAKGGGKKSLTPKNSKATAQSAIPRLKAEAKPSAARYVCPMGDYEGDKPGQCPKCGMTLVKKE